MSEYKLCPKCSRVMEEGRGIGVKRSVVLYRKRRRRGVAIVPYACPGCGYIEVYAKPKKGRSTS